MSPVLRWPLRGPLPFSVFGLLLATQTVQGEDSADRLLASLYGDEQLVQLATGRAKPLHLAPAVATVINAADIAAMGARDLNDVLQSVPGLHVSVSNSANAPRFLIRGIATQFNPQTLILINGVPINDVFAGNRSQFWGGMPVRAISRIEIMRSPGSALYGADAFAGAVNIITKSPAELEPGAGMAVGSYNSREVWWQWHDEGATPEWGLSLEWQKTDGHDPWVEFDAQTALDNLNRAPRASLAPGRADLARELTELRADWQPQNTALGHWRFGVQDRRRVATGMGTAEALRSSGEAGSRRYLLDGQFDFVHANAWSTQAQLSYYWMDMRFTENNMLLPPGGGLGAFPQGMYGNPEIEAQHTRIDARHRYEGLNTHVLTLGWGWHENAITETRERKNFDGLLRPLPAIIDACPGPYCYLSPERRDAAHLLVQDEWQVLPDVELTLGVRRDDYSDFGGTTNPRFAAVWAARHDLTLKLLAGRAFRAPTFTELYGINNPQSLGTPDLQPERIETRELVFDWQMSFAWRFTLNLFSLRINDAINYVPDNAALYRARNIGEQDGDGAEFEWQYRSGDWRWLGHASVQDLHDARTGSAPNTAAPEQKIYQRLEWRADDAHRFSVQWYWVGERPRSLGDPRPDLDGYQQWDLVWRWQPVSAGWNARLLLSNAFDEDIREPSSGPRVAGRTPNLPFDRPMPGRQIDLALELRF